jgi:hypothetical protein
MLSRNSCARRSGTGTTGAGQEVSKVEAEDENVRENSRLKEGRQRFCG